MSIFQAISKVKLYFIRYVISPMVDLSFAFIIYGEREV